MWLGLISLLLTVMLQKWLDVLVGLQHSQDWEKAGKVLQAQ